MRTQDRFLMELYRRTDGQCNCTVHSWLHVAKPLRLSEAEARMSIMALVREGLIGVDTMFNRLIWLTPTGVVACEQCRNEDTLAEETAKEDTYVPLIALRGTYADIVASPIHEELSVQ